MSELDRRIASLSAAKQELLELQLRRGAGLPPPGSTMSVAELVAESALDPAIVPRSEPEPGRLDAVLLTGATGFVGAFLLDELLAGTRADVHCLVRAPSPAEGRRRILLNLRSYGLGGRDAERRVVAVVGDLSRPSLGLQPADFRDLAARIDAVYHCGAVVNWTYPYRLLKPANVLGTQEVLRLATLDWPRPVHFVSTVGVFSSAEYEPDAVLESEALERSGPLAVGYAQTKWVAERMVRTAGARGLPVAIYRPAIGADSRTGAFNRRDHVCLALKGCIQLGSAPTSDTPVQIAPVDFVARALVALSLRRAPAGKAFHLVNPKAVTWRELFDLVRGLGYRLRPTSLAEWQAELAASLASRRSNALAGLLSFLFGALERSALPRFDCARTLAALADTGIACPPIDERLLGTYFRRFVDSGFLEPPEVRALGRYPDRGGSRARTARS